MPAFDNGPPAGRLLNDRAQHALFYRGAFFLSLSERAILGWRVKLVVAAILVPFYNIPYFLLQRFPARDPITFELTWLDRAVHFDPRWTWVYVSLYTFHVIAAVIVVGERLIPYVFGMILMAAFAFVCFFLVPVTGPRPPLPANPGLYGLLVSIDRPLNSFPSLHVGMVVLPLLLSWDAFRAEWRRGAWLYLLVMTAWGILICYSTLATRQHYAVDALAGAALAAACYGSVRRCACRTPSLDGRLVL